jgi:glutathione S-transferase
MTEFILHHYPMSPYSEKIRVAFGVKGLAWRSVIIPAIMPKPDLMPLTGGYRKTPVMQVGADVFCDTQLILREIERRVPEPPLFPKETGGLGEAIGWWAERALFGVAVSVLFAKTADQIPQAFREDRAKMSGRDFDPARMRAADPMMRDSLRAQLSWLEEAFAAGRKFVAGDRPTAADLSLYHMVWFVRRGRAEVLEEFPGVLAWADRLAAIGHGQPRDLDAEEALAIAKAAAPATPTGADPGDPSGRRPGQRVAVAADDYGRDPVVGELVASSPREIAIRRHDPEVGEVVVHFPRAGFVVTPA